MIRRLCYLILKLRGWKFEMKVPNSLSSFILLGAPHTSNHDFLPAMAISWLVGRRAKFAIKSEWLKFPLNLFMLPIGAYGINRNKDKGLPPKERNTETMARFFKDFSDFVLMITPEGTRKATKKWKTGFYHVAQKAKVPILLGYADFEKKEAGIGLVLYPTDFEEDMRKIMDFYRGIKGKVPQKFHLDERFS